MMMDDQGDNMSETDIPEPFPAADESEQPVQAGVQPQNGVI